jgi:hypothetical protein
LRTAAAEADLAPLHSARSVRSAGLLVGSAPSLRRKAQNFFSSRMDFAINCSRVMGTYRTPGRCENDCHSRKSRACRAGASRQKRSASVVPADFLYAQDLNGNTVGKWEVA